MAKFRAGAHASMDGVNVARNPLEEEASSEEEEFALRVLREGVTRNQEPGTRGTGLTGPLSPPSPRVRPPPRAQPATYMMHGPVT